MRRALTITACVLVAGCGGGEDPPELEPAPAAVAREVRAVFRDYTAAMGREDFATACRHLTEASVAQLASDLEAPPRRRDCAALLGRLYGPPGSDGRRQLGEVVRTLRITGVDATDRRDTVLVAWSAEVRGARVAVRQPVTQVDGRWQLVAQPAPA